MHQVTRTTQPSSDLAAAALVVEHGEFCGEVGRLKWRGGERVLVVTSPLRQLLDEMIRLHRDKENTDMVVIDAKQRAFSEAIAASLHHALARLGQIQFTIVDDDEDIH